MPMMADQDVVVDAVCINPTATVAMVVLMNRWRNGATKSNLNAIGKKLKPFGLRVEVVPVENQNKEKL
jgi:hypothetical protein